MTKQDTSPHYSCRNCGLDDHLDVVASVWVHLLQFDGRIETEESDDQPDHEWDDSNQAICRNCGWAGPLHRANDSERVAVETLKELAR